MKELHSEMTGYKDMVLAMHREICGNSSSKTILWDSFTANGDRYAPHSVIIDRASQKLVDIGFMPMFIYDKQHFRDNMYPEHDRPHAHGSSVEDMLRLPQRLNHPVAIVSERAGRYRSDGASNHYDLLTFLSADYCNGSQHYYLTAVQPQDYHDGLITRGYASKVISYYEIDSAKFNAILRSSLNGQRELLYFDKNQYRAVRASNKPIELVNKRSMATPIIGHYTPKSNLKKIMQDHQRTTQYAITSTLNRFVVGTTIDGTTFPLFSRAVRTLTNKESDIKDILNARSLITKISNLCTDRVVRLRTIEQTDKMFAEAYSRIMSQEKQDFYIKKASKKINDIEVTTSDDLEYLLEEVEKFSNAVPTLKNLNIAFTGSVAGIPSVMRAHEISGKLEIAMETCLADIVRQKNAEFEQQKIIMQDIKEIEVEGVNWNLGDR